MISTTLVFVRNSKDEILLGYKSRGFGEGRWNAFGGKFEDLAESTRDATVRELQEEATIVVKPDELVEVGFINFIWPDKERECHVYTVTYDGTFQDSDEMTKIQWFPVGQIPYDQMRQADKEIFPLLLENEMFSSLNVYYDEEHNFLRWENRK